MVLTAGKYTIAFDSITVDELRAIKAEDPPRKRAIRKRKRYFMTKAASDAAHAADKAQEGAAAPRAAVKEKQRQVRAKTERLVSKATITEGDVRLLAGNIDEWAIRAVLTATYYPMTIDAIGRDGVHTPYTITTKTKSTQLNVAAYQARRVIMEAGSAILAQIAAATSLKELRAIKDER